jgi:hypothetical protein
MEASIQYQNAKGAKMTQRAQKLLQGNSFASFAETFAPFAFGCCIDAQ